MAFASINTLNTTTPAAIDAQHTVGAGEDCCAIYIGPGDITESHFYLYVRVNSGDVRKVWTTRYSRVIFHGLSEGDTVSIGSDSVRAIEVIGGSVPNLSTPNWGTSIANADKAEPRVWEPTAPHVTMGAINKLTIVAGSGWRDIFVREYDGSSWGPCCWYRTHPTYTGDIVIPVFGESVALCTQDGSAVVVKASSEATVGGTSVPYELAMPTISATSNVTANDGADFLAKLQAATSGTNVVLPAGTYTVASQIQTADWAQGVTISGATGDPDDVIIELADTDYAIYLDSSWSTKRGLRYVTFSVTADHGAFRAENAGLLMESVKFAGDQTRTGVDNVMLGTSGADIRCHNCESNNSAADNWNGISGGTLELINCRGDVSGPGSADQVITSHLGQILRVYGGSFGDSDTNVYARATSAECHMEFTEIYCGDRQSGLLGAFGFGCRGATIKGQWNPDGITGYQMFWRVDNTGTSYGQNLIRNLEGLTHGNWFANIPSTRQVYYSQTTGTPETQYNFWSGCLPSTEAIIGHLAGSAGMHSHRLRNNTFFGNRVDIGIGSALSGDLVARNNAHSGSTYRTVDQIGTADWTTLDSDYNIYDRSVNTSNFAGADDIIGSSGVGAELTSQFLPSSLGNAHDSGDGSLYDWIGGRGFTAMPLIYSPNVVSRGALERPTDEGIVFPDAWNGSAVPASDEDDEPDPPPSPDPTGNYYTIQALLATRSGGLSVLWKANTESLVGAQVSSPTYAIYRDSTLLASGNLTWSGTEFISEELSEALTPRQVYTLKCTATIGGESVTREQLIFPRY